MGLGTVDDQLVQAWRQVLCVHEGGALSFRQGRACLWISPLLPSFNVLGHVDQLHVSQLILEALALKDSLPALQSIKNVLHVDVLSLLDQANHALLDGPCLLHVGDQGLGVAH